MTKAAVEVVSVTDHPDGSCTLVIDMDVEAMKVFAIIGLHQVLIEKAKEVIDGHIDPEGAKDAGTGKGSDTDFHEQFPGF